MSLDPESWRMFDPEDFIEHISKKARARLELGEQRYKSSKLGFQGVPLPHLEEEMYDALFYIWMDRQRGSQAGCSVVHTTYCCACCNPPRREES